MARQEFTSSGTTLEVECSKILYYVEFISSAAGSVQLQAFVGGNWLPAAVPQTATMQALQLGDITAAVRWRANVTHTTGTIAVTIEENVQGGGG